VKLNGNRTLRRGKNRLKEPSESIILDCDTMQSCRQILMLWGKIIFPSSALKMKATWS
jgi:hypothetical protein